MLAIPWEVVQTASDEYAQKFVKSDSRLKNLDIDDLTAGAENWENDAYSLNLSGGGHIFISGVIIATSQSISVRNEIPNDSTIAVLQKAESNYVTGNTSPTFETGEEAIAWLEEQGI